MKHTNRSLELKIDQSSVEILPAGAQLPSEVKLLLACARTIIEPASLAQMHYLAQSDLDWDILLDLARWHGVVPLLYSAIQRYLLSTVPQEVMLELRENYLAGVQRAIGLAAELTRLVALFNAAGIRCIPIKGPILAMAAYGNLALRQFSDLDILVPPEDVLAAKSVLLAEGYHPDPLLSQQHEVLRLRTHYVYAFTQEVGAVCVELHYRLRPRYFAFALGWNNLSAWREQAMAGGTVLPQLATADQLLFLCAHGANHCWERLAWICDIAELLRRDVPLDWESIQRRAQDLGCERMLLLGLMLAHELLNATLPEPMLSRAYADHVACELAADVCRRLGTCRNEQPGLIASSLFHLRARERWRDRLAYCLGVAFVTSAEDWALLPLPTWLMWVYSLVRPFRLLIIYGFAPLLRRLSMPFA